MKTSKKLCALVLSFVLAFACIAVVPFAGITAAAAGSVATEDAVFIGSAGGNKTLANIFVPIGAKGAGGVTWSDQEVCFKVTFKCKLLSGTQPIVGVLRTNYGSGDSTYSEMKWAFNNNTNYTESHTDFSYTTSSYNASTGTFTAIVRAWYNETNYYRNGRWCYITIGNAEHNAAWHEANDYNASFILSQPQIYAYNKDTGETYGDNLAPAFSASGCDFNGTYFARSSGCAQYDSPYYATADQWHIDSAPSLIHRIKVPTDFNTSSNYNAANFSQVAETDYVREYYTNSNYPGTYFAKLKNSNNAGFQVINDLNKKMIIIDANHEGEADDRTTDGYSPVYNRPANIFLPISFGQYNMNVVPTDGNFLVKVSMKAVRLEGDGYPVLGRIVGKKSVGSGGGSQAFGKMAKNLHLSGYYGAGSHETYTGGDFSYNESTGDFVGWMRVRISDNDYATKWGVNEVITIGNAEHVWQEGTFDTTEFNTSFAISNVKVDVYSCTNPSSGVYAVGSLVASDVAPELTAENIDVDSPWAYQYTGSGSNHTRDLVRASQYLWQADGCVGMVHAKNLTPCMKNKHTLTHHAATASTREYWSCASCSKNFADPYGLEAVTDLTATEQMLILPATGSGSQSVFCPVKLNGFENNQWFKFTCKVKCFGDGAPVVSSLYAKYDGTDACETTISTSNDGDFSFFESSYDPETGILTGYLKAWIKDSINKGSRYPFERYNPVSGANGAIVIGNGRYVGNGYAEDTHTTGFVISEPELYKIAGATTGGTSGLADAKTKSVTGENLLAPVTDKTVNFEDAYVATWTNVNNPLSAPLGKWYRTGSRASWIKTLEIPDGYFDTEDSRVSFKSHSLVLTGEIGVNFFMDLSDLSAAEKESSHMVFAVTNAKGDVTDEFDAGFTDLGGNGYYGFTCFLSSVQMADLIVPTFYIGENAVAMGIPYSVKDYIDYVVTNSSDTALVTLVKALGDYGHYAQGYLGNLHSTLHFTDINKYRASDYSVSDYSTRLTALSDKAMTKSITGTAVSKVSYNLNFDSGTYINVKLTAGEPITASATVDGKTLNASSEGNFRTPGLPISKLGDAFTLSGKGTSNTNTFTVTLSGLSYIRAILNSSGSSTAAKNAMAALYDYYNAARAYAG